MRRRTRELAIGMLLMALALILQTLTLASGDYRNALLVALASMLLADALLLRALLSDGQGTRIVAAVLMLPSIFIVFDFLRRAPFTFTGG